MLQKQIVSHFLNALPLPYFLVLLYLSLAPSIFVIVVLSGFTTDCQRGGFQTKSVYFPSFLYTQITLPVRIDFTIPSFRRSLARKFLLDYSRTLMLTFFSNSTLALSIWLLDEQIYIELPPQWLKFYQLHYLEFPMQTLPQWP